MDTDKCIYPNCNKPKNDGFDFCSRAHGVLYRTKVLKGIEKAKRQEERKANAENQNPEPENNEEPYLLSLPFEIMDMILTRILKREDIKRRISIICSYFYNYFAETTRHLSLHLDKVSSVYSQNYSERRGDVLTSPVFFRNWCNVRTLKLRSKIKVHHLPLRHFLTTFTNLYSLDNSRSPFANNQDMIPLGNLTNMTDLNLKYNRNLGDAGIENLSKLTSLSHLDLGGCTNLTDLSIVVIMKSLTNLSRLCLNQCNLTDAGLADISSLVNLTELELDDCVRVYAKGLTNLKFLTKINRLSMKGLRLTNVAITHMYPLSQLSHLDISNCANFDDGGLNFLKKLSSLKHLDISYCNSVTNNGLLHLSSQYNLQAIYIKRNGNITDSGLGHLKYLTNLETLDVESCSSLSDSSFGTLKPILGKVKINSTGCFRVNDQYTYYGNYAAFVTGKDENHKCDESYSNYNPDIYKEIDSNQYVYEFSEVTEEKILNILEDKKVILLKNFVSPKECEILKNFTDTMIDKYHNEDNLNDHSAYPKDDQGSRVSWAFALAGNEKSDLPSIQVQDECSNENGYEVYTRISETIKRLLNMKRGRTLFNVQKYYNGCPSIRPHHDGEVMKIKTSKGRLYEVKALFPDTVALLTLRNNTLGGGTKIHFNMQPGCHEFSLRNNTPTKKHQKVVMCAQQGDLLLFNNIENEHSVDELFRDGKQKEGDLIRHIIGWRSLEENCYRMNTERDNELYKEVSYERAIDYHKKFLKSGFDLNVKSM